MSDYQSHRRRQKEASSILPSQPVDPRILASCYVPSDPELVQLKAALMESEEELARHRCELADLRRKVEDPKADEWPLLAKVEGYRSAVSVLCRVPVEIWETIFSVLCTSLHDYSLDVGCDDDCWEDEFIPVTPVIQAPALTLSQVSARWRKIVNACPRLWSSISIQLAVPTDITLLRTYLERSKTYPLSLKLSLLVNEEDGYTDLTNVSLAEDKQAVWQLLVPHLARCRQLFFEVPNINIFSRPDDLKFPNLISFRITPRQYFTVRDWSIAASQADWIWAAIRQAPQLTDVVTKGFVPRTSIPYQQLRSITIHTPREIESEDLLQCLLNSKSVASLTLGTPDSTDNPLLSLEENFEGFDTPIEIPSLRTLTIDDNLMAISPRNTFFATFFPKLKLPALTSFSIDCRGWPPALTALLRRCAPILERVTIRLNGLYHRDSERAFINQMLPVLQSLSRLTHLEIGMSKGYIHNELIPGITHVLNTLLSTLECQPGRPPFLPKLESVHLAFSDVKVNAQLVERMLDMVSSRRRASTTCPLTSFRVALHPGGKDITRTGIVLEPAALERMRELKRARCDVVFDRLQHVLT